MRIIHKALGISVLIHLAVMISWVVFPSLSAKKVYTPVYQVSLVTQPEPPREEKVQTPKAPEPAKKEEAVQPPKTPPPPKEAAKPEKKPAPPVKKKSETQVRKKETSEKRSLKDVQKRIDAIRQKMASSEKGEEQPKVSARIAEARRNAYFDTIAAHVQANWSLLKNQMENVGTLTTDIGLQIRRDGTVTMIVIEKPSGNALFDEFAVRAVKRSNPLPPFPEEVREDRLEVTIGLSS
jgi:TonB family protein